MTLTSSGQPTGFVPAAYVSHAFLFTKQSLHLPSGSSVEIYTTEFGGIINLPVVESVIFKLRRISAAEILTFYL